jgi:hypothetical protein
MYRDINAQWQMHAVWILVLHAIKSILCKEIDCSNNNPFLILGWNCFLWIWNEMYSLHDYYYLWKDLLDTKCRNHLFNCITLSVLHIQTINHSHELFVTCLNYPQYIILDIYCNPQWNRKLENFGSYLYPGFIKLCSSC